MDGRVERALFVVCGAASDMPPASYPPPSPFAFIAVAAASAATFYYVVKQREGTAPASQSRRLADNPLIPVRHREDEVQQKK